MAVVYRSLIQFDTPDARALSRLAFGEWLDAKRQGRFPPPDEMRLPDAGERVQAGPWEIESRCEVSAAVTVERLSLTQEDSPGERWSTDIVSWNTVADGEHWVWVECSRVSDAPWSSRARSIPGIIGHLLKPVNRARFGNTPLLNEVFAASSERNVRLLANTVFDAQRQLPVFISTSDDLGAAEEVLRRVKGNALVAHVVADEHRRLLSSLLGTELDVYVGSLRTYLPGIDRHNPQPWRHQYVPRHRIDTFDGRSWDRVTAAVVRNAAQLRPPMSYRDLVHPLLRPRWTDADIENLMDQVADLTDSRDRAVESLRRVLNEKDDLSRALDQAAREARWLRDQLPDATAFEASSEIESTLDYNTFEELITAFVSTRVVLGDEVTNALELDDEPERSQWARVAQRALGALDRYATAKADGFRGSFEHWLASVNDDLRTDVIPTESKLTKKDKKFARLRTFEVPEEVDRSGSVVMWAHIRIGHTGLTPRLHFHDDTGGKTGKVFVGYIGEHLDTAGTRRRKD